MQMTHMDNQVLWRAGGDIHSGEEPFCDRWYGLDSVSGWWGSIWWYVDDLIHQRQAQSEV